MPPRTRTKLKRQAEVTSFRRACRAVIHDHGNLNDNSCGLINIHKGKKLRKDILDKMYESDPPIISRTAGYICECCVEKFNNSFHGCTDEDSPSQSKNIAVDKGAAGDAICEAPGDVKAICEAPDDVAAICDAPSDVAAVCDAPADVSAHSDSLSLTGFTVDEKSLASLKSVIDLDVKNLYKSNDNVSMQNLVNYKPSHWLKERPADVVCKICDLFSFLPNEMYQDEMKALKVAKVIEIIYSERNSRLILPLSFRETLLTYHVAGSKILVNYNGAVSPAGSYSHLLKWLDGTSSRPIEVPHGAVRCVFDNEQVIGKRYNVTVGCKTPTSVITSKIYIVLDAEETLQEDENLCPSAWLYADPNDVQKQAILCNVTDDQARFFRETRNDFISSRLALLLNDNNNGNDIVDKMIAEEKKTMGEKECPSCGADNDISKRVCSNCGQGHLSRKHLDLNKLCSGMDNPYEGFEHSVAQKEDSKPLKIVVGEPDLRNPSSFENIAEILRNIGKESGIAKYNNELNSVRQWMYIECDGGIYPIVWQLIRNVLQCNTCKCSFYGLEAFQDHLCAVADDDNETTYGHEFDWIVLVPGLLHLEMNAGRSFVNLNWDIFMKEIARELGFESQRALEYAKKGSDHHKMWKMLEITYLALTDELLTTYVRACGTERKPTVDGYWEWTQGVHNPNYIYLQQMTFTYLHGLMLLRDGSRKGNAFAIETAKAKLSPLFFGRHHPTYRRIVTSDKFIMGMMPNAVREALEASITLSRTGSMGHFQGGDACLEEVNKDAKSWKPPGVPSDSQWLRIFRNLDDLNKVREILLNTFFKWNRFIKCK